MSKKRGKISRRIRRQIRVRRKVKGTTERPRLCVFRSLNNIYVQAIDDEKGVTIASASTLEPDFVKPEKPKPVQAEPAAPEAPAPKEGKKGKKPPAPAAKKKEAVAGYKVLCSQAVGALIATRLKEKGVSKVVFDRNGFLYHGRVRAVADAARKAGLVF